jgi:tRNA(fMet)-specific endonuclease VapC
MNGRYLLDTTIAIAVLEGEVDLTRRRGKPFEAFLSAIVLGELFFGAEKSRRVEENKARIRRLISLCPVLLCDEETAQHYGIVKKQLQRKGRPIPENDIWIAASARQHGLILAARDGHYEYLDDDLPREVW